MDIAERSVLMARANHPPFPATTYEGIYQHHQKVSPGPAGNDVAARLGSSR